MRILFIVLALSAFPDTAYADFVFRGRSERVLEAQKTFENFVIQGFGEDISLEIALEQIAGDIPINVAADTEENLVVHWTGGRTRKEVLDELLLPLGLLWEWSEEELAVRPLVSSLDEDKEDEQILEEQAVEFVWKVPPGITLRQLLQIWAPKAEYALDWEAGRFDYQLHGNLEFRGTFEDAVASIFEALARQGVKPTPEADFYRGSRTLVISVVSEGAQF